MLPFSDAVDRVLPFVSTDDTRPHMFKPARWSAHVVATDGHTMAVVRYDFNEAPTEDDLTVHHDDPDVHPPPFEAVTPYDVQSFGEWLPGVAVTLPHYPHAWNVCVSFGGGKPPTVQAGIPAREGKRGKVLRPAIRMILEQPIDGFDRLESKERVGVNAGYLQRVVEFFDGLGVIRVYGGDPLSPLVFTSDSNITTKKHLLECPGYAIVMPMRM